MVAPPRPPLASRSIRNLSCFTSVIDRYSLRDGRLSSIAMSLPCGLLGSSMCFSEVHQRLMAGASQPATSYDRRSRRRARLPPASLASAANDSPSSRCSSSNPPSGPEPYLTFGLKAAVAAAAITAAVAAAPPQATAAAGGWQPRRHRRRIEDSWFCPAAEARPASSGKREVAKTEAQPTAQQAAAGLLADLRRSARRAGRRLRRAAQGEAVVSASGPNMDGLGLSLHAPVPHGVWPAAELAVACLLTAPRSCTTAVLCWRLGRGACSGLRRPRRRRRPRCLARRLGRARRGCPRLRGAAAGRAPALALAGAARGRGRRALGARPQPGGQDGLDPGGAGPVQPGLAQPVGQRRGDQASLCPGPARRGSAARRRRCVCCRRQRGCSRVAAAARGGAAGVVEPAPHPLCGPRAQGGAAEAGATSGLWMVGGSAAHRAPPPSARMPPLAVLWCPPSALQSLPGPRPRQANTPTYPCTPPLQARRALKALEDGKLLGGQDYSTEGLVELRKVGHAPFFPFSLWRGGWAGRRAAHRPCSRRRAMEPRSASRTGITASSRADQPPPNTRAPPTNFRSARRAAGW